MRSMEEKLELCYSVPKLEYQFELILNYGTVPSPTAKCIFLGDPGVGKTSTCRHLMGKAHPTHHEPTLGIDERMAEWTHVDDQWQEINENEVSQIERAVSYRLVYPDGTLNTTVKYIPHSKSAKYTAVVLIFFLYHIFTPLANDSLGYEDLNVSTQAQCPSRKPAAPDLIREKLAFWAVLILIYLTIATALTYMTAKQPHSSLKGFHLEQTVEKKRRLTELAKWPSIFSALFFLFLILASTLDFPHLYIEQNSVLIKKGNHPRPHIELISLFLMLIVLDDCHEHSIKRAYRRVPATKSINRQAYYIAIHLCIAFLTVLSLTSGEGSAAVTNIFAFCGRIYIALCVSLTTHDVMAAYFPTLWRTRFAYAGGAAYYIISKNPFMVSGVLHSIGSSLVIFHLLQPHPCPHPHRLHYMLRLGLSAGVGVAQTFTWLNCLLGLGLKLEIVAPFLIYAWFMLTNTDECSLDQLATTALPIGQMMDRLQAGPGHWPVALSLLDCAGHAVYRSAHHLFMAAHAFYILVFRLPDLCHDYASTERRLFSWADSVVAHALHPHARMAVVATHAADVDDSRWRRAVARLSRRLTRRYASRLLARSTDAGPVFLIDNAQRATSVAQLTSLKCLVWQQCDEADFVRLPNRVAWFAFLDAVATERWQQQQQRDVGWAVAAPADLWARFRRPCRLRRRADLARMLHFFSARGNLLFCGDAAGHVLLEPRLLHACVRRLLATPGTGSGPPLVSRRRLRHSLRCRDDAKAAALTTLLRRQGVVAPLPLRAAGVAFLLLPRLPRRPHTQAPLDPRLRPAPTAELRFTVAPPPALFLRLVAASWRHGTAAAPHIQHRQPTAVFADAALLRFRRRPYSLSLDPGDATSLLVHCHRAASTSLLHALLRGLDRRLQALCRQDRLDCVEYALFLACPCRLGRARPHLLPAPVLDRRQDKTDVGAGAGAEFPQTHKHFLCHVADEVVTAHFGPHPHPRRPPHTVPSQRLRPAGASCDAFVSCHADDRYLVLAHVLPIAENLPKHCLGQDAAAPPAITLQVNFDDDPTPDHRHWIPIEETRRRMRAANCVLLMLSQQYIACPRCRREMDLAHTLGKPIVPVILEHGLSLPPVIGVQGSIDCSSLAAAEYFHRRLRTAVLRHRSR